MFTLIRPRAFTKDTRCFCSFGNCLFPDCRCWSLKRTKTDYKVSRELVQPQRHRRRYKIIKYLVKKYIGLSVSESVHFSRFFPFRQTIFVVARGKDTSSDTERKEFKVGNNSNLQNEGLLPGDISAVVLVVVAKKYCRRME